MTARGQWSPAARLIPRRRRAIVPGLSYQDVTDMGLSPPLRHLARLGSPAMTPAAAPRVSRRQVMAAL